MIYTVLDFLRVFQSKKVYGLVGPPGSGKSFRAFLIAEKYNIEFIIDDGLLLKEQKIIAGKSAKKEKFHVTAVKRAIFHETKHAREVRKTLYKSNFKNVLILATSENMLNKIVSRLHLPSIHKIIKIEDIATQEEIQLAQKSRKKYGKHVMPIPLIEVKKLYPNLVLHAIHMFSHENKGFFFKRKKNKIIEKTIVRPNFGLNGNISISEPALVQMIEHCIAEYSTNIKLLKVKFIEAEEGIELSLDLSVDYTKNKPYDLMTLQTLIKEKIQNFTGIEILDVNINISKTFNKLKSENANKNLSIL